MEEIKLINLNESYLIQLTINNKLEVPKCAKTII
jgi:hypothetical protein